MNQFDQLLQTIEGGRIQTLHHAYAIFGNPSETSTQIAEVAAAHQSDAEITVGVRNQTMERLGIDTARFLRDDHLRKPTRSKERWYVVAADDVTTPAQNALLKTLEEPTAHARFFLCLAGSVELLETLESRVECITVDSEDDGDIQEIANEFLNASLADRLEMAESWVKKDEVSGRAVLREVTSIIHSEAQQTKNTRLYELTDELTEMQRFGDIAGANHLSILRHVALVVAREG